MTVQTKSKHSQFSRACAVATLFAAAASPVLAAGPFQVTSQILVEAKQAAADGTTRVMMVPARKAVPGDRVVFRLNYRNTGNQPISNIVLDNPVPQGIAYIAPVAGTPQPELSVDGKSWGALATLRIRGANGAMRSAAAADVTHVRWRLTAPVAAGSQGQLSFQGTIR